MNPGASYRDSDHISPHPLRRSRKNVIESDPEDDDDVEPPLHKYTRPEGSTPTYNMDTDISTLEAPTFTTLSHKENVLQALKWDHQPTLIGTKVVNPILHVCDKCQHPIIRYGRLNCKHVLCHSCASGLMKEGLNCIRCNTKVTGVEEVGLGRLFVCSYGGSRYGSDGCRRTYLSERDLNAHVDFRHLKQPQTSSSNNLPSTEAINAATAALAASTSSAEQQNVQSQRGNGDHRSHHKMSRTSNQNQNPNNGGSGHAGHHPPSFSQNQFSQPPPTVMTSAAVSSQNNRFDGKIHGAAAPTAASSSNLITVPIQDNSSSTTTTRENSNEYWTTSKVPIHQPPPNYYNNPGQNQQSSHHGHHGQHQHHHYSTQVSSGGNGNSNYGSSGGGGNYRTASGYHRR